MLGRFKEIKNLWCQYGAKMTLGPDLFINSSSKTFKKKLQRSYPRKKKETKWCAYCRKPAVAPNRSLFFCGFHSWVDWVPTTGLKERWLGGWIFLWIFHRSSGNMPSRYHGRPVFVGWAIWATCRFGDLRKTRNRECELPKDAMVATEG